MATAKHWCFTINNPTDSSDYYIALFTPEVDYGVFQREKGQGVNSLNSLDRVPLTRVDFVCSGDGALPGLPGIKKA